MRVGLVNKPERSVLKEDKTGLIISYECRLGEKALQSNRRNSIFNKLYLSLKLINSWNLDFWHISLPSSIFPTPNWTEINLESNFFPNGRGRRDSPRREGAPLRAAAASLLDTAAAAATAEQSVRPCIDPPSSVVVGRRRRGNTSLKEVADVAASCLRCCW